MYVVCCKLSNVGLLKLHRVVRYAAWVASGELTANQADYYAMVEWFDDTVGRLRALLRATEGRDGRNANGWQDNVRIVRLRRRRRLDYFFFLGNNRGCRRGHVPRYFKVPVLFISTGDNRSRKRNGQRTGKLWFG